MLPQAVTNRLLPLQIDLVPDETVRVMVGRLEIVWPEGETRITTLVQHSAAGRRVCFALAESCPQQDVFARVWQNLQDRGGDRIGEESEGASPSWQTALHKHDAAGLLFKILKYLVELPGNEV